MLPENVMKYIHIYLTIEDIYQDMLIRFFISRKGVDLGD